MTSLEKKLTKNEKGLFALSIEMKACLKANWKHVVIQHKSIWQPAWFSYENADSGCVCRLGESYFKES